MKRLYSACVWLKNSKIPYWLAMALLSLASYLYGKAAGIRPENPDIVIDNSAVDCNCEVCTCQDAAVGPGKEIEDSTITEQNSSVADNTVDPEVLSGASDPDSEAQFVASKNGSKYYPLNCSSADRIKEENRVYYADEEEAEQDGKTRAEVCKEE